MNKFSSLCIIILLSTMDNYMETLKVKMLLHHSKKYLLKLATQPQQKQYLKLKNILNESSSFH